MSRIMYQDICRLQVGRTKEQYWPKRRKYIGKLQLELRDFKGV